MAWAWLLDAQTCPWANSLHTSRLYSTAGARGFRIGVVLLLDWLPTNSAEPRRAKDKGYSIVESNDSHEIPDWGRHQTPPASLWGGLLEEISFEG